MTKKILLASLLMTSTLLSADDVVTRSFPNGLTWIHRPVRHNAIAAVRLLMPSGVTSEAAEKAGVSHLMTSLLMKGTAKRNALQFAQAVESLGASLDAGAQEDYWQFSGQVTTDRFAPFFSLFQECLLSPVFPEDEVLKERDALLNDLKAKNESIFTVAHDLLARELYGAHPYARPDDGTPETVSRLTRVDVVARHEASTDPRGAVLVTVGNMPMKELTPLVEGLAAAWTPPAGKPVVVGPTQPPAGAVTVEEPHPFEQSYFMLAWPAPAFGAKDYAAIKVLNAWLGAGMSSPLFMKVREEKGLAYEVASFYPTQKWGSAFTVYAGMAPANLNDAQARALSVVADAVKAGPTAEEVASAKRYIRGHFAMDHQTNGRQAWYLAFYEIMGKGWRYDAVYPRDVDAVTVEDVRRVAREIFSRAPVTIRIRSNKK